MSISSDTFVNAKPEHVLKTVFGYDDFRDRQKDIVQNVLSKKDTLVIMPTGGGKSLCYQIPALILEGITLVVSPLISLMQDQVASLEENGIHCVFLNSALSFEEYKAACNDIKLGKVKIVYVSPEGLATARTRDILSDSALNLSCIAIDEAHCVSQWGHDFRPDYLEIASIRNLFPEAVMIALTATATSQVRDDICTNLKLRNPSVFISSFNRKNIFLEVIPKKDPVNQVITCIKQHIGESGIIYCNSRKQVDELTDTLDNLGYSVLNYHAGLTDEIRAKNQEKFIKDQVQIIVATIAFGMGIDKPNVRFVINYDLPKSVEEYYQEIGRAGRDGLPSTAVLLFSLGDIHKVRYFFENSSDPEKSEYLLQGMLKFAQSRTCRRRTLLNYFGENFNPDEESKKFCCDICEKGEIPLVDVTIPVQKFLSCILRTGSRFGTNYVIDVLLGSHQKRILDNNHNMLSTFGIGCELNKDEWMELVEHLLMKGIIRKTGEYNILELTSAGRSFLSARDQLSLPMIISPKAKLSGATEKNQRKSIILHKKQDLQNFDDPQSQLIADELRTWRKKRAEELDVPPYVIFGDKTLYDIATKKPTTSFELLRINGIGENKLQNYGKAILRIVRGE